MIKFIVGAMLGSMVGVVTMCLCAAAGEADKRMKIK